MKARFLALAALVLGMVSCQQDVELATPQGGEVDFQLKVDAVELSTRAGQDGAADTQAAHDSAFGAIDYLQATDAADAYRVDWTEVDLRYSLEVYDKAADYTNAVPVKDRQVVIVDKYEPVVFDLRLVPNREYHFVVFADFVADGEADKVVDSSITYQAELGLRHNIGANLGDITIKDDAINDERGDAYFATKDITISNSAAQDIVLKRPYGKLRVIATDLAELNLNVDPAAVKVEYTAFHANKFNAVTGKIDGAYTEKVYTNVYNEISKEDVSKHVYTGYYESLTSENANKEVRHTHLTLFTDYILANPEQSTLHFTMSVYDDAAMADVNLIKATTFNTEIPVQRNYLTTIIGNVLTTATEVEVTIDDNFINPDKEHIVDASLEDQLAAGANKKELVIDLTADVMWETGAAHGSTPLIPADAVTEKVTINGNGYKFIATGAGVGPIGLANGGKLIFNDVVVVDQTESYAEGSWEFGYLEMTGKLEFNDCVIDNTIALDGEEVVFNNCRFNDKVFKGTDGQEYAAWVSNGKAYFNNCDFYGARGVKVHEAYGSEVEEVVIDNCRFHNLTKKPGVAIGTVNAATKIVIKNSTFENCQPGDQGLYIYETDTDVTTFDFTNSNNSITAGVTETSLEKLLKSNLKEINATLESDASINTSVKWGGADTKRIVIDGAKVSTAAATGAAAGNHKLTITTSYMSRIETVNPDVVIVLKNLTLTNNLDNGTWDIYDIAFDCNVELENVVVEKALALDGEDKYAKLTNVTIKESHDYYALWISAVGQTVDIENLVVESAGRGIKIDEQYVKDALGKVTLNVKDAKFTTANKAAIMVKSAAGADINLNGVDIAGVAADKVNAVWVDEDAAEYASLVNVNGGSMIVEGQEDKVISNDEDLKEALEAAGAAGAGNTTLILAKDAEIDMTSASWEPIYVNGYNGADIVTVVGNGATLKGLTAPLFKGGFAGGSGIVIKDLTITESNIVSDNTQGSGAFIECVDSMETIVLDNCHFTNSTLSGSRTGGLIGWTSGYSNVNDGPVKTYVTIKNCSVVDVEINATGSAGGINGHAGASDWTYTTIDNCTVKNCKINSEDTGDWRTGVVVGTANVGEVAINNITASGNTINQVGKTAPTEEVRRLFGRAVLGSTGKLTIDGYSYVADGVFENPEGNVEVGSQEGLQAALAAGCDVVLYQDIIGESATTAPYGNKYAYKLDGGVLDGNDHELYMECYGDDYGIMTSGGTIKNLTITEGCRAVMIMYPTQDIILDNVKIGGDGVLYPINTGEAGADGVKLSVSNSTIAGWTSYSEIESASFTNVKFEQGTYYENIYGRVLKPYVNTYLADCSFIEHMNLDLSSLEAGQKVTFKNCTVNGQAVNASVFTIPSNDAEYDTELFTIDLPAWASDINDCVIFE